MKILLLGEFSGLHNNLKDGLIDLGHEVVIASAQDGFKKIPVDINFESNLPGFLGVIGRNIMNPIINLHKLVDFDVVQIMNPFQFYIKSLPSAYFLDQIIKNNKKTFLLAAGSDAYFWRNGKKLLKYGPFEESLKFDYKSKSHYMELQSSFDYNNMYQMHVSYC